MKQKLQQHKTVRLVVWHPVVLLATKTQSWKRQQKMYFVVLKCLPIPDLFSHGNVIVSPACRGRQANKWWMDAAGRTVARRKQRAATHGPLNFSSYNSYPESDRDVDWNHPVITIMSPLKHDVPWTDVSKWWSWWRTLGCGDWTWGAGICRFILIFCLCHHLIKLVLQQHLCSSRFWEQFSYVGKVTLNVPLIKTDNVVFIKHSVSFTKPINTKLFNNLQLVALCSILCLLLGSLFVSYLSVGSSSTCIVTPIPLVQAKAKPAESGHPGGEEAGEEELQGLGHSQAQPESHGPSNLGWGQHTGLSSPRPADCWGAGWHSL